MAKKRKKSRQQWRPEAGSEDGIFGENPRRTISAGDKILLTWEGSDQREVREVISVEGGAVNLRDGGFIRDDLPRWDEQAQMWTYCYSRSGGE